MMKKKFGVRIRQIRKEQGLSQAQLSFDSFVSRSYIGMVERGERNPTLGCIENIANALKVTIEFLFHF